jgi:hypothetical protein
VFRPSVSEAKIALSIKIIDVLLLGIVFTLITVRLAMRSSKTLKTTTVGPKTLTWNFANSTGDIGTRLESASHDMASLAVKVPADSKESQHEDIEKDASV